MKTGKKKYLRSKKKEKKHVDKKQHKGGKALFKLQFYVTVHYYRTVKAGTHTASHFTSAVKNRENAHRFTVSSLLYHSETSA